MLVYPTDSVAGKKIETEVYIPDPTKAERFTVDREVFMQDGCSETLAEWFRAVVRSAFKGNSYFIDTTELYLKALITGLFNLYSVKPYATIGVVVSVPNTSFWLHSAVSVFVWYDNNVFDLIHLHYGPGKPLKEMHHPVVPGVTYTVPDFTPCLLDIQIYRDLCGSVLDEEILRMTQRISECLDVESRVCPEHLHTEVNRILDRFVEGVSNDVRVSVK